MGPATEVAIISLHAGTSVEDPSSPAGSVWQEVLNTIADQPGCQEIFWGSEVENPTNIRLLVDWNELEDHIRFMKSSIYKPFMSRINTIVSSPPVLTHAHLSPSPLSATITPTTPILEFFTGRLSPSFSPSTYEANAAKFSQKLLASDAAKGSSTGSYTGGVQVEPDAKDKDGKVFMGMIGWISVDAHMQFRQTDAFKDMIGLLREGLREGGASVVHVAFRRHEVARAGGGPQNPQEEVLNPTSSKQGGGKPKTTSEGETKGGGVGVQFIDGHR